MLASYYPQILALHVGCVVCSGALFTVRGVLRVADRPVANHRVLRKLSYVIDTTLLVAALLLAVTIHQYPFLNGWLTMKVGLLGVYIVLGVVTLRHARTRLGRCAALLAALLTFVAIVGVAIAHHPAGWLMLLRR